MKVIGILVAPTGETTVLAKGFAGASCRDASKFIEKALGRQVDEQLTAEFHQAEQAEARNQQRN